MIHVGEARQPSGEGSLAARADAGHAAWPGMPELLLIERDHEASAPHSMLPTPQRIGVVCVHGIGDQKPGDTMLSWARALERVLRSWMATTAGVPSSNDPVTDANIDFSGASRPFVRLNVPPVRGADGVLRHREQDWFVTEAWWASRVRPPTTFEMFTWLFPREMWRIVRGIVSGTYFAGSRAASLVDFAFLLCFWLPGTLLVGAAYFLFEVLRHLPIPGLRDFAAVKAVEFFLVDWFGDVRVLLSDRAQAANIRSCVAAAIRECLDAECETVVLIGHSGGTIVGYMTLTDPAHAGLKVRRFITHGQALGLAWKLGHADDYTLPDRDPTRLGAGDRLRTDLASTSRVQVDGLDWWDFWGSHDPACGGGLRPPIVTRPERLHPDLPERGRSTRILNRMSVKNDHGAYWDNDEEFVLPVARLIDLAPDDGRTVSRFFPEGADVARVGRRHDRVNLLQAAWFMIMASAVLAVVLALVHQLRPDQAGTIERAGSQAWVWIGGILGGFEWAYGFLQIPALSFGPIGGWAAVLAGVVALLAAYWVVGRVMVWLWDRWDRRDRHLALQPAPRFLNLRWLAVQLGFSAAAGVPLWTVAWLGDWLFAGVAAVCLLLAVGASLVSGIGGIVRPRRWRAPAGG